MKQEYINDCPDYLEQFLTYLKVIKDRGDRTEEAYYIDLRMFLRYLKVKNKLVNPDIPFEEIEIQDTPFELVKKFTLMDAYTYLKWLKDDRQNETASRARKTTALKQFYEYLTVKAKLLDVNPMAELELPHVKNKLPKYLSLEQSKQLLESIGTDNEFADRDYCIITLFLNCGMRLSELCGLNMKDISFENQTVRLFGKGRKERIVYLNQACLEALKIYMQRRNSVNVETDALFLSKRNTRISKRRVQQIVEESLKKAGLSNTGVTTHKLRHTAATLMYQYGNVDTLVLKDVLGHQSISTTEIYTHLSDENKKAAADASPLSDIKPKK
jgi:site-specific recombinase XerD